MTGFVLKTDILQDLAVPERCDRPLSTLSRKITTVYKTASLSSLLDQLVKERQHVALVVGEHGGTEGLVTMEDLMETLLGNEIVDEVDQVVDMRSLARRRWLARAKKMGLSAD